MTWLLSYYLVKELFILIIIIINKSYYLCIKLLFYKRQTSFEVVYSDCKARTPYCFILSRPACFSILHFKRELLEHHKHAIVIWFFFSFFFFEIWKVEVCFGCSTGTLYPLQPLPSVTVDMLRQRIPSGHWQMAIPDRDRWW